MALRDLEKRLFADVPNEDVAQLTKPARTALLEHVKAALSAKGSRAVRVETVDNGPEQATVVIIRQKNRPFIVDSVLAELARRSMTPLLVAHPLIEHDGKPVSVMTILLPAMDAAARKGLKSSFLEVLDAVRTVTDDWRPMRMRVSEAAERLAGSSVQEAERTEAIAFLHWLLDDNFVLLGVRDYALADGNLKPASNNALGILRDKGLAVMSRSGKPVTMTAEIRAFLDQPDPLIITKADARSLVHRNAHLDYVGVKRYAEDGSVAGELRIVGLFTSTAYTRSLATIPVLRRKANAVLETFNTDGAGHTGKALTNVLETWPRDDLFQIETEQLAGFVGKVLVLEERPRIRVLARPDGFNRFVSILGYVPRERYDSRVREQMGDYFAQVFDGRVSAFYPSFLENGMVRVHFIIGRGEGKTPQVDRKTLEDAVTAITRTWEDRLAAADPDAPLHDFTLAYQEAFDVAGALSDAAQFEPLSADDPIAVKFYSPGDEREKGAIALKIHHFDGPLPLSERVPTLENFGFAVIEEVTHEVHRADGETVFIHDMLLRRADGEEVDVARRGEALETALRAVWRGEVDDDAFNALVLVAGLDWRMAGLLRACGLYLRQLRSRFTPQSMAQALARHPQIAADLFALFDARFSPDSKRREVKMDKHSGAIINALEAVTSPDDDRIIRNLRNVITATLRTNYYAPSVKTSEDAPPPVLALKIDPSQIPIAPKPVPYREIFVSSPQVEGTHLRFGPVARGGLRWSDRPQDYRTEVLGLVKAQQVKNAVIVPVGSKGGFFAKRLPERSVDADVWFQAGRDAYKTFISSLLSLTDNLVDGKVVHPAGIVRHDGDDPYFVVAADKGTATFSDTANAISQARDFWLDDAFASGGSAGYDHKVMGITARGAWEAVKRHFREMGRDIQKEPFSAIGVGDMSGDVFGNGMLLSKQTRLIAAFDHRDIFIDPDPDIKKSFAERRRLFKLGRSSWADYNTKLISKGGGVFSRQSKTVQLSKEAAGVLGCEAGTMAPQDLLTAILKSPTDLLWFGGIGTYVKAKGESDGEVGDRANDPIRIDAKELRVKVVGEGANLGMTQPARIAFGLRGGRVNSDAIDNSAGVNSSDVEVNIKIALAAAMRSGKLTRKRRNTLLESMTEDVAALVLENNYEQTLALSLAARNGLSALPNQQRFMQALERRGRLDRVVEDLPDDAALADRQGSDTPLTRPELGVLLAYAKIVALDDLVASDAPDDPYFSSWLHGYFPEPMQKSYDKQIDEHRLRREIISTRVVNAMVNRGGPAFLNMAQERTGADTGHLARAYVTARDTFGLASLYGAVDALDNKIDPNVQLELYARLQDVVVAQTFWFARNESFTKGIEPVVARYAKAVKTLSPKLESLAPQFLVDRMAAARAASAEAGVPKELAERLAALTVLTLVPDMELAAGRAGRGKSLLDTAKTFFAVTKAFRVGRIVQAAREVEVLDPYDALALDRAMQQLHRARRDITVDVLAAGGLDKWAKKRGAPVDRARATLQAITEGGAHSVSRLTVAASTLADLALQ
jgi:glutamate dehydrogenase